MAIIGNYIVLLALHVPYALALSILVGTPVPHALKLSGLYADTRPVGARRGGVSDWFLRPGSAGQRDEPVGALGGFKRSPGWHV